MALFEHRSSSLRETFAISFPLMLASLSLYLMYVVDRIILACYSLDALNAAVPAVSLTWAFWGGISVMAGMSEVFMAQHRFQNQSLVGRATWHSIWLTLAAAVILIPVGLITAHRLYHPGSAQYDYFFWSMLFGMFDPLSFALTTFFVGQGKTRLILQLTIAKIAWNAAFDYALIFGIPPLIPSLGAKGAAMASGISMLLQLAILFYFFLKKENRALYGIGNWRPHLEVLIKTVKIAGPPAVLYNIELWGWGLFYTMMAASSSVHITISSLCESLVYLFIFVADGLYRGTLLQANNSIAQGKHQLRKIFTSGSIILGACLVVQLLLLTVSPYLYLSIVSPLNKELIDLLPTFEICMRFVLLYLFFQGIQWLLWAFLCAMGETKSMLIAGSISLFSCLVFPTYFLILKRGYSVEWAWGIVVFYSITCCIFYSAIILARLRKRTGSTGWQALSLTELQSPMQIVDKVG